jgi:glycosyltransferase involved in cell wall biosynthesis
MKLAIVTPTYFKLDGSTANHLRLALESVKNQTHQDYKLFLIGDDYSNSDELFELAKIVDRDKIYVENLPVAVERIKYSGMDLWRTSGVNASNVGVRKALSEGYDYVCHLDHDDMFLENHLMEISDCIEATGTNFVSTKCGAYPPIETDQHYTEYRPETNRLFKVSTCVNYRHFGLFFRNMIEETGKSYAADADMWNRIKKFMEDRDEYGVFVNVNTAKRNGGGTTYKKPEIVK